jgi:50S ribosomal protein L16 3-hydroxylase
MTPGLAALIAPRATSEVMTNLARDAVFAVHGMKDSLAELFAIPVLASLEALLGAWPDRISVHLPDVADEASSVSASPHDARRMFASGMSLLFDDAHLYAPPLVRWLHAIRADLGLSTLTQQRCLIYATPAGKGTKTWTLAPNAHVARPLTRHTIGQPVDPELQSYARLPMPDAMPADRTEIVLEPGSVLVVPRGVWHSTRAATDALALNFTFTPPTWLDLFTAALRSRLALAKAWRETAVPRSPEAFEALLRELAGDAAEWNATDILAATEAEPG